MRTVIVASGTLFEVAATYLGDATQWDRIAALNGIDDPWLQGLTELKVPDPVSQSGGRVGVG